MDPWDPSLPGAGAQRAVLIVQLYMRMGNYTPLSVLVSDALALTFGSNGATVTELSAYLGLSSDRVDTAIWGIPKEVRCTSADLRLDDDDDDTDQKPKRHGGVRRSRTEAAEEESTLRHYINYAVFLPFAYAHGTHMLLALCQVPLPDLNSSSSSSLSAVVGGEAAALNVSPTLRRADGQCGLRCSACRYWMALQDLNRTISRCPVCQSDILAAVLRAIQTHYEVKLSRGLSLAVFGPSTQRPTPARATPSDSQTQRANTTTTTGSSYLPVGELPLSRDPFLVQQALFFQFLYSTPFVCVNDQSFVVDVDEVMTREEYAHRAKHKATVLDQFRLVHRNASSIRVKLVDQHKVDAEKYHLSALKVAKRSQLPPWLRSTPCGDEDSKPPMTGEPNTALGETKTSSTSKRTKQQGDIAAFARFIAREFFDDDYDEVPLRTASRSMSAALRQAQ